jgi:hypothetical protein
MDSTPPSPEFYNVPIQGIASKARRATLATVSETEPVDLSTLAERVSSKLDSQDSGEQRTHRAQIDLVHKHLPALQAAGLLTWDRDTDMVELTDHPALGDSRFHRFLDSGTDRVDNVLEALTHEFRRVTLTILWNEQDSIGRDALAERLLEHLAEENIGGSLTEGQLAIDLHHRHLPKLAAQNFIEYDIETGQIRYTDDPLLDEVFRTVYEVDQKTTDRLSAFLSGLSRSYQETNRQSTALFDWPDSWRVSYDG